MTAFIILLTVYYIGFILTGMYCKKYQNLRKDEVIAASVMWPLILLANIIHWCGKILLYPAIKVINLYKPK